MQLKVFTLSSLQQKHQWRKSRWKNIHQTNAQMWPKGQQYKFGKQCNPLANTNTRALNRKYWSQMTKHKDECTLSNGLWGVIRCICEYKGHVSYHHFNEVYKRIVSVYHKQYFYFTTWSQELDVEADMLIRPRESPHTQRTKTNTRRKSILITPEIHLTVSFLTGKLILQLSLTWHLGRPKNLLLITTGMDSYSGYF
jgi:hypothetical protein